MSAETPGSDRDDTEGGVISFGPGEVWLDPETGEFTREGTDHDDTEGQDADVLALMREIGPIVEERRHYGLNREDAEVYARTVLASDWLAAYVTRKVEAARAETRRWREMWDKHGKNDLLARAEKAERERDEWKAVAHDGAFQQARAETAERERDEARSEERRRTLLWLADEIDPTGYGWTSVRDAERFRQRLRDLATEPASDRPLTLDELMAWRGDGTQAWNDLITGVERILTAREAAAERPRYMVVSGCIDTEDYARISNDAFDSALEQVIEELHDYCNPDDDADTAAILRGFAAHLGEWRPEVRGPATVPDPAAERRGAVNALREAARSMSIYDSARTWLLDRADRIEAGDD